MMYSTKKKRSGFYVLLAVTALLLWSFGAQGTAQMHSAAACDTCESDANSTTQFVKTAKPQSPFIQKLRAARETGDIETLSELDRQIPRTPSTGEGAGGTVIIPTTSVGGIGNLREILQGFSMAPLAGPMPMAAPFGTDVLVSGSAMQNIETHCTLAIHSSGTLFTAVQDDSLSKDYIQVYYSTDSGKSWDAFGYISNASADLVEPCIAVGDGMSDAVLVTYIVDDGVTDTYPEVARSNISGGGFTVHSVPLWVTGQGYAKPVIWTDSPKHAVWYAYLTCEWIYDMAAENINVGAWRCTDGTTWGNGIVVFGDSDTDAWRDPDGSYGTSQNNNYLCCYNDTTNTLNVAISDNDAATYDDLVSAGTLAYEPILHTVDPEIEAAITEDNVMICCTSSSGDFECIRQGYSDDAGATWSTFWVMNGTQPINEFAPALVANQGGGNWHLVYTSDHHVKYTKRPQDLSAYWESTHLIVDDAQYASHDYPKKGIATHWYYDDVCGVVWADYRDSLIDYDIYFDFTRNNKVYVPTDYSTIQTAIDLVPGGFEVLVEPGRYKENLDFKGKPITLKSTEGAMWTFLDGNNTGSTVSFVSGEKFDSVVEGFTIHNGNYPSGGGINCTFSTPTIRNNIIVLNNATYGAGIFCYSCDPTIINNTIYDNWAVAGGGGLYCKGTASPQVMNTIFWNDHSTSGAVEIGVESGSPTVDYCVVQGGFPGYGNLSSDPQFVSTFDYDFHITWNSPCRDAGFSAPPSLPDTDFEGDPRIAFGHADIGADEFHRHFYYDGKPYPNGFVNARLIDVPGSSPVGFWFGAGISDPPYHHPLWGDWYLTPPYIFIGPFGAIPANGVLDIYADVPAAPPAPYEAYLQAYIAGKFTNLMILRIIVP
ncbi:MAG: right-handed parallel beta-helix repeat-containing protein [Planctomycetota bacterium]